MSLCVIILISYSLNPIPLNAQQKLYDDLFSVSFPSEKEGWACGRWGTVLHTLDGGKTWVKQSTGVTFTLMSIYFSDSKNGWAVGDAGTILHTEDGGKTWVRQKSPVPYYLMGVYFVSQRKGWVVTERTHILHTVDGGKTWSIQFKDGDYILKSVSFANSLCGWAVGEYGYIYHTENGGVTWRKQGGAFELSEGDEIIGDPFLFSVVGIDPQTAWAVGLDGYVKNTVDGGKTWKVVETGASKSHLFCVASDKKETILIGGRGVFLSSPDKGKTWKTPEFEPHIRYGWLYGITQRGNAGFLTVGLRGSIYISNSLTSWKKVNY